MVLDEGSIHVASGDDGGTVRLIVASRERSGGKVPGTGGGIADHFYVHRDSRIAVEIDSSMRFQVLAPTHFFSASRVSGSEDPRVVGTIVSPASRDGSGRFIVRDAELFGSVVTGDFAMENNAEVHFDRASPDEEISFGEDGSPLEFVHLTEHRMEVEGT